MPDWKRIGEGLEDESAGSFRAGRAAGAIGSEGLRALVSQSEEGMVLADADARILFANPAAGRLLGVPPEDLLGRAGSELLRPEHLDLAREMFGRIVTSPLEPIEFTMTVLRAEGREVTLEVRAVSHLPTPGVEAIVAHFHEASPVDDEPGTSYRSLFENALVGLGVADLRGNLLAFNDAMLRPGGYTREDILEIGNVGALYAHASDRPRVLQILRARGYVWRERVPFVRKDGSTYDTLLTLTPVVFQGQPCLYATVEALDADGGPGPMEVVGDED